MCPFFQVAIRGFKNPVFAKRKGFAEAAATARSRCGLRSRECTKFSVKRPRRSENSGTHRTRPRRLHLSDIRKDVCLCLGRERIIGPLFAQQKLGSPKRRKKKLFPTVKSRASNELREPHQRSKKCEMRVPTLAVFIFQTSFRMSVYVWCENG